MGTFRLGPSAVGGVQMEWRDQLRLDLACGAWGMGMSNLRRLLFANLTMCCIVFSGCADSQSRRFDSSYVARDLLFNAAFMPGELAINTREPWPVSLSYQRPSEEIEYRETVIDRQGWFNNDENSLYRRFETRRKGRARR